MAGDGYYYQSGTTDMGQQQFLQKWKSCQASISVMETSNSKLSEEFNKTYLKFCFFNKCIPDYFQLDSFSKTEGTCIL